MIKKILKNLIKTLFVIFLILLAADLIFSYVRYHNYYNLTELEHPTLGTSHKDYIIGDSNASQYPVSELENKVKLLYWHTGCPASTGWLPRLMNFANAFPKGLEVFIITEESQDELTEISRTLNITIVKGHARWNESRFKHTSSSHLVILDKNNVLRAYGYQLKETEQVLSSLIEGKEISPENNERLQFIENDMQSDLKHVNNFDFKVSSFNPDFEQNAGKWSINYADYKNSSISHIYQMTLGIPNYRVSDNTGKNLDSNREEDLYCVYYKTQSPLRPLILQILFDDKTERRNKFEKELKSHLDEAFGLKSIVKLKETKTLVLKDIVSNEKNEFKEVPRTTAYIYEVQPSDNDTTSWNYSYNGRIDYAIQTIERKIEMPVVTDIPNTKKYHLILGILDKDNSSKEQVIANLEGQGFVFEAKNTQVEYLEISEINR